MPQPLMFQSARIAAVYADQQAKARQAAEEAIAREAQYKYERPVNSPKKVPEFNNMARLQTLVSGQSVNGINNKGGADGQITINIPHLPETISLARENTYDTSGQNLVMPDGFWIYQHTGPLEIPIEFTLHAYDELCPEGANSLLLTAASLHALQLPASNDALSNIAKSAGSADKPDKAVAEELQKASGRDAVSFDATTAAAQKNESFKFPPACSLRLMQAGPRGFGIHCVGFVKSVKVDLHGPYMNGPDGSEIYNLPSAATYSFVFVHNPSYTNLIGSGKLVNAYGPDVLSFLYNTRHLAELAQNNYADIEQLLSSRKGYGRAPLTTTKIK